MKRPSHYRIDPMTFGNMCANSVRSLDVCHPVEHPQPGKRAAAVLWHQLAQQNCGQQHRVTQHLFVTICPDNSSSGNARLKSVYLLASGPCRSLAVSIPRRTACIP
jgi:hypothetical protein